MGGMRGRDVRAGDQGRVDERGARLRCMSRCGESDIRFYGKNSTNADTSR